MSGQEISQIELTNPPTDGITSVLFCKNSTNLIVTSWDKSVTIHDVSSILTNNTTNINNNYNNNPKTTVLLTYEHLAGVLDSCLHSNGNTIFSAGCDCQIKSCDITSPSSSSYSKTNIIGTHTMPIRCIEYCEIANILISGSWDKTIKLWDIRQSSINTPSNDMIGMNIKCKSISSHMLSNKVFALDIIPNSTQIIVGTSDRCIYIYDIRNMSEAVQKRESSLKHQTRKIVCHPNGLQFVVSAIEGRVAVEYLDPSPDVQLKKYAFKCHRVWDADANMQSIYPVNAIAFHPLYHTFATGGGDGYVNIWDGINKKRLCQFSAYKTSIASLDFSSDGGLIAVAESYTWEQGTPELKVKDSVWIRRVKDTEIKPKVKKGKKK